jgi:DNA polymerase III delta subunit
MPPRPPTTIDALEKAFADGEGPSAVALVGSDGYLVAEARNRLERALEASGTEVRGWDGGANALADQLRTGSLFGGGVAWILEDPEWLVGAGGDGKRKIASIAKSAREGKGDPARRLLELLASRGVKWDPEAPAPALDSLEEWLAENDAEAAVVDLLRGVIENAARARVEAPGGGDPSIELERALSGTAPGNRLLLLLGGAPPKSSPASRLLPSFTVVPVELPPGDKRAVLGRMAELAAKEAGVRIAPAALAALLDRTAPPDRPERGEGEGSIRLFRGELDKLLSAVGPGGTVGRELVDSLVADASPVVLWDLDAHLASRDTTAAVLLLRRVLGRGRSGDGEAIMTAGYLAGLFRRMVGIHQLLGADGVRQASRTTYAAWKGRWLPRLERMLEPGKKDFPLYKSTQSAGAWQRDEVEMALRRLAIIDRSAKSGGPPAAEQLEAFLLAVVPRRNEVRRG